MSNFGFVDFTHAGVEAGKLPVTPAAPKDRLGWEDSKNNKFKGCRLLPLLPTPKRMRIPENSKITRCSHAASQKTSLLDATPRHHA